MSCLAKGILQNIGFQYGYQADSSWWSGLTDPPGDIGQALLDNIPNATDLYWVDFTVGDIWPVN